VFLSSAVLAKEGAHLDPDGARLALRASIDDVALVGRRARLELLLEKDPSYARAYGVCGVRRLDVGTTARIYRLSQGSYVVLEDRTRVLLGRARPRDVALGVAILRDVFGEETDGLTRCAPS
jgi:hypothetical protein